MKKIELIIKQEDLLISPKDWHDWVAFVMSKNSNGQMGEGDVPAIIIMDDKYTEKFLNFLKLDSIRLYVKGHPVLRDPEGKKEVVWDILAIRGNEGQRLYVGGENMRTYLDHHNVHYKTSNHNELLLSVTEGCYLKKDGEDCRAVP